MSTQIAVRLPEDLVEFTDRLVADGRAPSRAAVVSQALQRERRRELAACDAAILAAAAENDDLDALTEHAARTPPERRQLRRRRHRAEVGARSAGRPTASGAGSGSPWLCMPPSTSKTCPVLAEPLRELLFPAGLEPVLRRPDGPGDW